MAEEREPVQAVGSAIKSKPWNYGPVNKIVAHLATAIPIFYGQRSV